MPSRFLSYIALFLLFGHPCWAQHVITTFAGRTWTFDTKDANNAPAIEAPLGTISGLAADSTGNIFAADSSHHIVVKILPSGQLQVVAGNGSPGFSGDGGPANAASLNVPRGLDVDTRGNLYIADTGNHRVRKVTPEGTIFTFAGGGSTQVLLGDGLPATAVSLYGPGDVALDSAGNLFITDFGIWKVTPEGTIKMIASIPPVCGNITGCPPPPGPVVFSPTAIATDSAGNLYVAEFEGGVLKITPEGKTSGFSVGSRAPLGIALDSAGNIYVANGFSHRVLVRAPDGSMRTISGNGQGFLGDGGPAISAYFNRPTALAHGASGDLYVADSLNYRVRRIDASGTIGTIAGNGLFKGTGDGGHAVRAALHSPHGVQVDDAGNVYIADSGNYRVRKVAPEGTITTIAGTGAAGYHGDGGPAAAAWFWEPYGVALDAFGSVYIADRMNHRVRQVDALGRIATIAGSGGSGVRGDGGPATKADLAFPTALGIDPAGNLYISTQSEITPVRKVAPSGQINSVFGPPPANWLPDLNILSPDQTYGIAVDRQGNLYLSGRNQVSRLSLTAELTVIAGSGKPGFSGDGGPATQAQLLGPRAVAVDSSGNVYVLDRGNLRIRKVDAAGIISTIAGTGKVGLPREGMRATDAPLGDPWALAVDAEGNLYIADAGNDRIFKLSDNPGQPKDRDDRDGCLGSPSLSPSRFPAVSRPQANRCP